MTTRKDALRTVRYYDAQTMLTMLQHENRERLVRWLAENGGLPEGMRHPDESPPSTGGGWDVSWSTSWVGVPLSPSGAVSASGEGAQ